ncbi:MAG: hypothetical protein ACREOW_01855 [Thermodesulfobacteriota bacterium]
MDKKGLDYSTLHQLDSHANRLIRKSIWGDQDIGLDFYYSLVS